MKIPLVDLAIEHRKLRAELRAAFERVIDSGRFVLGPELEAFEHEVCSFLDVPHAIGVSSGTDALYCALLALGIGPGDEVVTSPFTFFATAGAIARVGASPRFSDICPETLNLDPKRLSAAIGPKTRAILPVHLFGHPADLSAIMSIAERHRLPVIEDAAQAFGAAWQGRRVGGFGTLAAFSFYPSKVLGGLGDGGMVVTRDAALAERLRKLRVHGASSPHFHELSGGGNFRLDELQAAFLRVKLRTIESSIARRSAHAKGYTEELAPLPFLSTPVVLPGAAPVWAHYVVRVRDGKRDEIARGLKARDIETAVYYRTPLHRQPGFAGFFEQNPVLSETEQAANEVLALPLYPELTSEERSQVVAVLGDLVRPARP